MSYFSSEDTIKAKVPSSRIMKWGDRNQDEILDPVTLEQALKYAKNTILGYLQTRYGAQILEWTFADVPNVLRDISDTLTIYYIATGNNSINDLIKTLYADAIATLTAMRKYEMDIPDVSDADEYMTVTETMDSDFDDDDDEEDADDWTTAPAFFPR